MSMEPPTGLGAFPVTKFCMVSTGFVSILASVMSCKYLFLAKYDPFIEEYHQYYRLFTYQFGAINESDVALLILIWYQLKHLERLLGSYKYINMISLIYIYTTVIIAGLSILTNTLLGITIWNNYPTGALPITLALFHFYKEYTPQIYEFEIILSPPWSRSADSKQLKWKLNDQFYIDALIALLLINQGLAGLGCGFLSWLVGVFLDKGLLPGIEGWRLPFSNRIFSKKSTGTNTERNTTENMGNGAVSGTNSVAGSANVSTAELPSREEEVPDDEPARPLGVQFLDTFRR
ncbi:hypothetical protein Kpol_1053p8 [Vanderwaltozyma polyspora DSM 70294]|uniref:Derlin n=1 Tax=Vanderwaltozyma polyspora (strain ATCC 22028 / DSM 70294 / BCRC 21397 / CBS 2163 / NBRC 10782 / NRRL Y-8283 / UCD 57-17) TaxID=436907 RepID=A7TN54_VANPO|nr:uncharacterized protein Kpol_1053p8 [Vanderwaltozyma polyspora DSM 70294]EDO16272.1 hypothetical protein Kpol_1053p8 [Vanderwaltozyma polyspora DSM 70294]